LVAASWAQPGKPRHAANIAAAASLRIVLLQSKM
jgi:hypothetical protein